MLPHPTLLPALAVALRIRVTLKNSGILTVFPNGRPLVRPLLKRPNEAFQSLTEILKMKTRVLMSLLATLAVFPTFAAQAREDLERIDIPVESALAPVEGYDDNDNVEVVLTGYLPDACHTLAESFVEHGADGKSIQVHQYALRKDEGVCAHGASMPPHMALMVPFTVTVPIGRLPSAEYRIEYLGQGGTSRHRRLNVAIAAVPTIDNYSYAGVTSVTAPDLVSSRQDVKVKVSGLLNSTCTALDDSIRIVKENDVYVVLPVLKIRRGVICAQTLVPFQKEVTLGRLAPGKYLVHVRSMNGRAMNRVIHSGR